MTALPKNPSQAVIALTETPKSLPPLIVKYSRPKLIFCFLAVLGFAAFQIWVVIRPWLVSFTHPDFAIWNDSLLGLVVLTPLFLPLWLTYLSYHAHNLRQAWRDEAAAIISDDGIFSPQWGYTIPWDKIVHVFIDYELFLWWKIHKQRIIIRAPVFLRPLQPKAQNIFTLFYSTFFDGRGFRGDVVLNLIILEHKYLVVERLRHYLGRKIRN